MTTLPNGATLIEKTDNLVLAKMGNMYVTWKYYRDDLRSTSHGNYFERLADAAKVLH